MDIDKIVAESKASQNKEELKALLEIVDTIKPSVIVEIGVHQGYSLEVWKKMWPDATIVGVDNDLHAWDRKATKDCYVLDADSHTLDTLYKVKAALNGRKIDFLFIDGDHTYPSVKSDFQMYSPLVRSGGIVALHDAFIEDNDTVKVYKLWLEIQGDYRTELIHFRDGTGVGVLHI